MHALYRFYDAGDALLYVGITVNPGRRLERHRYTQPWWSEVARIEMEQHPDLPTLRAAEREAIETEKPIYNIRMNGRLVERTLVWKCDECGKDIEDVDGYLTVSYADIRAYNRWHAEFDERQRAKAQAQGRSLISYSLSELNDSPGPARWRVLHRGCDPDVESDDYWYAIERCRTYPDLLERTAHLIHKTWFQSTTWDNILRRVA